MSHPRQAARQNKKKQQEQPRPEKVLFLEDGWVPEGLLDHGGFRHAGAGMELGKQPKLESRFPGCCALRCRQNKELM